MIDSDNNPSLPAPRRPPLEPHRKNILRNTLPSPVLLPLLANATPIFDNRQPSPPWPVSGEPVYTSTISNASRQRTTQPLDGEGKCAVHNSVGVSQKRPNNSRRDC